MLVATLVAVAHGAVHHHNSTANPQQCLAEMAKLCSDAKKTGVSACKKCLQSHLSELRPLCEGTGSGGKFCSAAKNVKQTKKATAVAQSETAL